MTRRVPITLRRAALFAVLVLGLAGCVAYPPGPPRGYGHGGWRAAPSAYAHAPPRPGWGDGWAPPYRRGW